MNIPTNASELREMLSDKKKATELANEGKLGEVVEAYVRKTAENDRDLSAQIDEQVQNSVVKFMRDNQQDVKNVRPNSVGSNRDKRIYNAAAVGAPLDKEFNGAHDFFKTIWHNAYQDKALQDRRDVLLNAASSHDGASGGFLVPEEIRSTLLLNSLETGVVRPRARVIPMSTPRVTFPVVDSTSNVSSVFGGITARWESESASPSATNPTFGRLNLESYTLEAYTEVPNNLLNDSAAFEEFMNRGFPEALAFYEDDAFLHGTGVGQPEGVYNADAGIVVAKESGQDPDTIVWQNIVKMYSRMLPSSLSRAVWVVPQDAFPELATMALSVGTGGSAVWLNNGQVGPPTTILGRPVVISEKAPKLGDEGDISFIDFGHYLIGDHQSMTAESSAHYKFQTSETAYKVFERIDGRLDMLSAITPKNGGPTLSPVVKLAARA